VPEPAGIAPFLVAILLCDQVIVEQGTGRKTLVGTLDRLSAASFPFDRDVTLFAKLTDAEGVYRVRVDFVHVSTDRLLGRVEVPDPVHVADRLGYLDIVLRLTAPIDGAGLDEFRVLANDAYLGRATLRVDNAPDPGRP